jgi:pyruvate/2-oxoglutarate dehydrogenase complex dihydrolipoamide dehydrogenase (E3) component
MIPVSAISPPSPKSEDTFLSGDCQLYFSTGSLDELPAHIAFVGGGYIAFGFAHIAARAGALVQIFHRGTRPLKKFDPDLVAQLVQTLISMASISPSKVMPRSFSRKVRNNPSVLAYHCKVLGLLLPPS